MAQLEACVRSVQLDGLTWGGSKLVPVGYGIRKLQIQCVVEDDKVGTDLLEEEITKFEDHVSGWKAQSGVEEGWVGWGGRAAAPCDLPSLSRCKVWTLRPSTRSKPPSCLNKDTFSHPDSCLVGSWAGKEGGRGF